MGVGALREWVLLVKWTLRVVGAQGRGLSQRVGALMEWMLMEVVL